MAILRNKSFNSIPTCLFIVAELDPLRDDSYGIHKKTESSNQKKSVEYF